MSEDKAKKDKPKADKAKAEKPKADKPKAKPEDGAAAKPKKDKAEKAEKTEKAEPPKPERKPADPRLKAFKKINAKLFPKGDLRDRHKAILARWNSGEDHGGVTTEEIKKLLEDWRASRAKPVKKAAAV